MTAKASSLKDAERDDLQTRPSETSSWGLRRKWALAIGATVLLAICVLSVVAIRGTQSRDTETVSASDDSLATNTVITPTTANSTSNSKPTPLYLLRVQAVPGEFDENELGRIRAMPEVRGNEEAAQADSAADNNKTIVFNGGPIMANPLTFYPIFYGNQWTASQADAVVTFMSDVTGSDWYQVARRYTDNATNTPSNEAPEIRSIFQNTSDSVGVAGTGGKNITTNDVWRIITAAINASSFGDGSGEPDRDGVYFLLTSPEISESGKTRGFCRGYCGWHTFDYLRSVPVKYAFVGNPVTQCPNKCGGQNIAMNADWGDVGTDSMMTTIAHEIVEVVTDPEEDAWYSKDGSENADLCVWNFGATETSLSGAKYNMQINDKFYRIQRNRDPKTNECLLM
ncbi:hypothetical protein HDU80_000455 [Chytriomyces hyalinus]|nr:hypothetical protein HDU80_000455 [Chytriomyces hyalinus]